MTVRAIRGATQLEADAIGEMDKKVSELVTAILQANSISKTDLISILFTATPDLVSTFPATAARTLGLSDIPLICAQEIDVKGAMERVVRVMVHTNSELSNGEIQHIYLHGAKELRKDLP